MGAELPMTITRLACALLHALVTSNSTRRPSSIWLIDCAKAVLWIKTSAPPSSRVMKPNPLLSLNHLIVPEIIACLHFLSLAKDGLRGAKSILGRFLAITDAERAFAVVPCGQALTGGVPIPWSKHFVVGCHVLDTSVRKRDPYVAANVLPVDGLHALQLDKPRVPCGLVGQCEVDAVVVDW